MKTYQTPIIDLMIIQSDLVRTSVGGNDENYDSIGRIPDSWKEKEV